MTTLRRTALLCAGMGLLALRGRVPAQVGMAAGFAPDAERLHAVLEEGDPSLYRYRTRAQIDSAFRALRDSALTDDSPRAFWRHVTETLAFIGDAHLSVMPGGSIWGDVFAHPLPIQLRVANDRLFVRRGLGDTVPVGSEIRTINRMSASDVISFCRKHMSADGSATTRAYRLIEHNFDIACGVALNSPGQYTLTFEPAEGGAVRTATVAAPKRMPSAGAAKAAGALRFLRGERIAVLTMHSFSKGSGFDPSKFMTTSFRAVADSGATTVIIDLRENGGGRDAIGGELFAHVARDTFTYARRTVLRRHFSFADWSLNWRIKLFISTRAHADGTITLDEALDHVQHPVRAPFAGRVIVLADRSTFSTASEVVALMQHYRRATIVGEETANARDGDSGATTGVMLPLSQFIVEVPLVRYDLPGGSSPGRVHGVMPDVPVEPSIADLLAGRDPQMDAAIRVARTPSQR